MASTDDLFKFKTERDFFDYVGDALNKKKHPLVESIDNLIKGSNKLIECHKKVRKLHE